MLLRANFEGKAKIGRIGLARGVKEKMARSVARDCERTLLEGYGKVLGVVFLVGSVGLNGL